MSPRQWHARIVPCLREPGERPRLKRKPDLRAGDRPRHAETEVIERQVGWRELDSRSAAQGLGIRAPATAAQYSLPAVGWSTAVDFDFGAHLVPVAGIPIPAPLPDVPERVM